nr:formin-like protein 5 [Tanacetum cinerariifolium]
MGAKGMVSFILAIVVLLSPLAAPMVSEIDKDAQTFPVGNLSNLDEDINDEKVNTMPMRRKMFETSNCEPHCMVEKEDDSFSWEDDIEPIPFGVSKAETGDGGGIDNTTIIIVVVSTAALTFLLAALLFCWYTKTYGGTQNDEKSFVSLSMGSSQKASYSMRNKSVKDPVNTVNTSLDLHKTFSSVNSCVSLGIPLDPAPDRLSAAGVPPLKPPPGRPDLALKTPPGQKDLSLHRPTVNASSPPNISPAGAAGPPPFSSQSIRAPSVRRAPSARRPPPPPLPSVKAPPPPPPLQKGPIPPPAPPPGGVRPPPKPPGAGFKPPRQSRGSDEGDGDDSNKAKLKPFFWDKVMTNPDQAMVWNQIRAGSFQFNEEMIENLFGYNAAAEKNKANNKKSSASQDPSSNFVQIIDGKKAQNLSILLKALNVTTNEVCDALNEGTELPVELIQTLLKMAPTGEEELKLRLYNGDISRLGTAERFLKKLVEIPFAYKRLESLLFMCTLQEDLDIIRESFETLEAACKELKKSRLFLKLLEAVLKTGNRMNDGTFRGSAQAFKLDTLLKLSDVKGVDGKTTLLHFVVVEIIRAEGVRASKSKDLLEESANNLQDSDEYYRNLGLQVVSSLCDELEDVKKAAVLDSDGLTCTVSKFGHALIKAREFLDTDLKKIDNGESDNDDSDNDDEFSVILSNFVQDAEKDVMWMLEEEKRIMALVKNTADYFHGQAGKDEGLRLFVIVRDFLLILEKVCKEIKTNPIVRPPRTAEKKDNPLSETAEKKDVSLSETKDNSSSPRTTKKDVSEPMTQDPNDLQRKTQEVDGLRDFWDNVDPQHDTPENEDSRNEALETEDSVNETQEIEDSRREIDEIYELLHETQETKSPYKMHENDKQRHETRLGHETHEPDASPDVKQENDDFQPKTDKTDYSRHEKKKTDFQPDNSQHTIEKTNDSRHETQPTYDTQEPDDLQHGTHEDVDLHSKTEENADKQPKTPQDDDSQRETHEMDDLQTETENKDVESTSERSSKPHQIPFRVPHERLIPAIAMRRVDSLSSSSSSDND